MAAAVARGCRRPPSVLYFGRDQGRRADAAGPPSPQSRSGAGGPAPERDRLERRPSAASSSCKAGAYGHYHGRRRDQRPPRRRCWSTTGASIVALSYEDASAAGLYVRDSDFTQRVSTANGVARVAPVTARPRQHRRHHRAQRAGRRERAAASLGTIPARHVVSGPPAARRHAQRRAGSAGVSRPQCVVAIEHVRLDRAGLFVTRACGPRRSLYEAVCRSNVIARICPCSPSRAPI